MAEPTSSIYSPLQPGQIRLVHVLPDKDDGELHCSLEVTQLDEVEYAAISYTWGRAIETWHTHAKDLDAPETYQIVVNNTPATVTQNLFHFLEEFRMNGDLEVGLWIDAVSINQIDPDEKTSQVNRMGELFHAASTVFVWLGRADEHTAMVREMMNCIVTAIQPQADFDEDAYFPFAELADPYDKNQMQRLGLGEYEPWQILEIQIFLRRCWFRRLWTVQEIAVAQQIVFRCGSYNFTWSIILHAAILMEVSFLGHHLSMEEQRLCSDHGIEGIDSLYTAGISTARRVREVISTGQLRPKFLDQDIIFCSEGDLCCSPAALVMILAIALRSSLATDARDKIFGVLGMVDQTRKRLRLPPCEVTADYTKSASTVFRELVTLFLTNTGNLNVLSTAEGCDSDRIANLPSWVPDFSKFSPTFSVSLQQQMQRHQKVRGYCPIDASQNQWFGFSINECRLRVSSLLFGVVTDVGNDGYEMYTKNNFEDTAALLLKRNEALDTIVDIFWKLMMLFETLSNVSEEEEAEFRSSFGYGILYLIVNHVVDARETHGTSRSEAIKSLHNLRRLMHVDTTGSLLAEDDVIEYCNALGCYEDGDISIQGAFNDIAHAKRDKWTIYAFGLYAGRPFLLDNGYLGFGPVGIEKGDELRIVSDGGRTPILFRAASEGNRACRKLVGEAFVGGIMYGEGVTYCRARGQRWSQMDIV